jgi:hypothetical protein
MRRLQKPESGDTSYFEFSDAYSNQILTCITIALDCLESDRRRRPSIGNIIRDLNESEIILIGEDNTQGRKRRERDHMLCLTKSQLTGVRSNVQPLIVEESKQPQNALLRNIRFIIGEFQMMQSFINVANEERAKNNVVRSWVRQVRDLAFDVEDCVEFVIHLNRSTRWWRRLLAPSPLEEATTMIKELMARTEEVSNRNLRYSLISDSGSEPVTKRQSATTKEQVLALEHYSTEYPLYAFKEVSPEQSLLILRKEVTASMLYLTFLNIILWYMLLVIMFSNVFDKIMKNKVSTDLEHFSFIYSCIPHVKH